jgi:hypothetical protein
MLEVPNIHSTLENTRSDIGLPTGSGSVGDVICASDRGWGQSRTDHRIQNVIDVGTACVPLPIIIRASLGESAPTAPWPYFRNNGASLESLLAALGGALTQY